MNYEKRINVKYYFDNEVRALGFVLWFFSWIIGIVNESWTVFLCCAVLGIFLHSTHYEVTLNRVRKYYRRAIFILGFRFGRTIPFEEIINCEIVKGNNTDLYMVGPFGIDSSGAMYHAFVKFSDGDSLQIGKNKDRNKLLSNINFFRFDYGVNIVFKDDLTQEYSDRMTKFRSSTPSSRVSKDILILSSTTLLMGILGYWKGESETYMIWLMGISFIGVVIGLFKLIKEKNKIKTRDLA